MELKKGYKQTEAGVIPEDWEVEELHQIAKFINGKAHEMFIDESGDYKVVNSKFVSSEGSVYKSSSSPLCPLNIGDITMVMSDIPNGKALAKCFLIDKNNTYTLNQRICALTPFKDSPKYLFNTLNRNKYFLAFDSGTGQTNLRRQEVLSCPVILPPKSEQTAIATALSDADAYITSLEKLIEKKRQIKQGTMQELLKPKDGWNKFKIKDLISNFQNGYGFSASGYVTEGIPIVTMAQIGLDGSFIFNEPKVNKWKSSDFNSLKDFHLNDGDLIIAMTDVTPDKNLIGRMAIVESNKTLLLNQRVGLLRLDTSKVNSFFLKTLSNMENWRLYCRGVASLGVQANIGTKDILKGEILLPSLSIQNQTSNILKDMDKEIFALKNKLNKMKDFKQGMMQQLLTGKIRII